MKSMDLTHTKKALKELDDYIITWDEKWNDPSSINNEIALRLLDELKDAENKVRIAFYEDTKDRNYIENCMHVGIKWLREMVRSN